MKSASTKLSTRRRWSEAVSAGAERAGPRRPAEIGGGWSGQHHPPQLFRRCQPCCDDLTVVEPQWGQLLQPQLKEMYPVASPVPNAAGNTGRDERRRPEADLLGQLA